MTWLPQAQGPADSLHGIEVVIAMQQHMVAFAAEGFDNKSAILFMINLADRNRR